MAYLPPAGRRILTDALLTYMPTLSEIPNPYIPPERMTRFGSRKLCPFDLSKIATSSTDEDWVYCKRPSYPVYLQDLSSMKQYCIGIPAYSRTNYKYHKCEKPRCDRRELPYGLPPEGYDVKRRADWFDNWKEHHYRYAGAYQMWERRYGDKFFY
ncbi:unnamed protein product [Lymnaea stagnalis]|uniref:Uncharacterized protein n=1 Tax=Lymnaea stagnalis TaxID=6523 RepID=A0AAV2IEW3_LYMST